MSELLPPNPDVSGLHYVRLGSDSPVVLEWFANLQLWRFGNTIIRPQSQAAKAYRYLTPIPSAGQLAAMREIMTFFAASLAAHEAAEGSVADDQPIWTGYEFSITAGMIRRAAGGK